MAEVGQRVGAVSHSDGDTVYLFGYGVYEGDFPRDRDAYGFLGEPDAMRTAAEAMYRERNPNATDAEVMTFCDSVMSNPRIRLDNGKTVWGCQCWWGAEEKIRASIGNRKVVMVDIDESVSEARAAAQLAAASSDLTTEEFLT